LEGEGGSDEQGRLEAVNKKIQDLGRNYREVYSEEYPEKGQQRHTWEGPMMGPHRDSEQKFEQ